MPRCRFETLAGWPETLVIPDQGASLRGGPGQADDHPEPSKKRPAVDTFVATCQGQAVWPFTLRVTVSQPDDCAFHCKGKDKAEAVCERERLIQGHTWKDGVEPLANGASDVYRFEVCLCYATTKTYGVLRMKVEEDIPESTYGLALGKNRNKPVPLSQMLEIILEG